MEHKEIWDVLDSTKIKAYLECPRKFFYEYVVGWRSIEPNIHLEFGKAWHLAMEHLLVKGYEDEELVQAYTLFHNHYRKYFPEVMDDVYAPKNPANAFKAMREYVNRYREEDKNEEVLFTEIAGTVPIRADKVIYFRMDSIIKKDGMYRSREHKTGTTVSRQWIDQWSLDIQTGIYNHVLHCLYLEDEVWGVEINGTFLQKKENKFQRVPARRTKRMMQVWFELVLDVVRRIEYDYWILEGGLAEDKEVMDCFMQNPTSCTNWFGCKFHDYCIAWSNPLKVVETEMPEGMHVSHWDPRAEEAKHTFNLEGV